MGEAIPYEQISIIYLGGDKQMFSVPFWVASSIINYVV